MKSTIKLCYSVISIMIISIALSNMSVSALGWGYQKSMNNQPPDVGKYGELIKNHNAIYKDDTDEKVIYLTFDNGYEQGYTGDILDVLQKNKVPATFFVTGHYVRSEPKLVKRMAKEGHIIGNHSNSHPDFTTMSKEKVEKELKTLEKAVAAITNQKSMNYLRPPRGTFNEDTLTWADDLGYAHIFWSLAFKDWETDKQQGWKYAYEQVVKQAHPGAIILLHTVSEDNAEALAKIIKTLKKDGYVFKSLDDLMVKNVIPKEMYQLISN